MPEILKIFCFFFTAEIFADLRGLNLGFCGDVQSDAGEVRAKKKYYEKSRILQIPVL